MDDADGHSFSTIEIELADKTYAPFIREKTQEGFTEDERSRLEFKVEDSRITITGPEDLLRRVTTALGALSYDSPKVHGSFDLLLHELRQRRSWLIFDVRRKDVNLHGKKMRVVQTAPNGIVGSGTVFQFFQDGNVVEAHYSGGRIATGYLVGILDGDLLSFRFCQISDRIHVDGGASRGRLETLRDGRLRIVESFTWESRVGDGVNIFEEVDRNEA
jgi:hypothetical protein